MIGNYRNSGRLPLPRGLFAVGLLIIGLLLAGRSAAGEPAPPPFDEQPLTDAIRQAIIAELKGKYEDDKHWGHTTQALRRTRLRGNISNLHWETRTKAVNDGLWKHYVVTVVEPEQQLHVGLDHLHMTDQGRLAFVLRLSARLRGEAQIERWQQGIKLMGTSAAGEAVISATINCDVGIRFQQGNLASDVLLDPHVAAIHLELVDLDVHRLGKLGGKAAHELGDSFTPTVERQLKRREGKLVEKANASIAKNRDYLRLPVDRFVTTGWAKIQSLLPAAASAPEAPARPETGGAASEPTQAQGPDQPARASAVTE